MSRLGDAIRGGLEKDTSQLSEGRALADAIRRGLEETPDELIAGFTEDQQLGPAGLESLTARLGIGTAESMAEKVRAFHKSFPDGDLRRTPGTGDLIFREDKTQPFAKVDAGLLEDFEPLQDIADVVNGALVGDIAVTVATRGGNLIPQMLKLFFGGAAGKIGEEGIEIARGTQDETQEGLFRDFGAGPPAEGTLSALGGGAGKILDRTIIDTARGKGLAPMAPEAVEGVAAFRRQGLEPPTPGMVTSAPFLKLAERQSSAISGNIPELVAKHETGMVEALERARDTGNADQFAAILSRADERERGRLLNNLRRAVKTKKTTLSEGGRALKQGVADYSQRSKKRVSRLYKNAEQIEEPVFSLVELKQRANLLVQTAELKKTPLSDDLLNVVKTINEMEDIPTRKVAREGDQEVVITAGDQIRGLRSLLFDLKTPALGDTIAGRATGKLPEAQAGELFRAVDDVLFKPQNANPAFKRAWRLAGGKARERFQTLDNANVLTALTADKPARFARELAQPRNFDQIQELRRAIGPASKEWIEFKNAFKTDLLSDPDNLTRRIKDFDDETLDLLLTRNKEIPAFVRYGAATDRLNKLPLRAIRESQSNSLEAISTIASNVNKAEGRRLMDTIKRGNRADKGVARASAIEYLWQESVKQGSELITGPKGRAFVDPVLFKRAVAKLEASGMGGILQPQDKTLIRDFQIIADFIGSTADPGTSLVAASIVREATSVAGVLPGGPGFKVRPFIDFIQLHTIGRVLASPGGRRILGGLGKNPPPSKILTALGAMATTVSATLGREEAAKVNANARTR
jgi:hypothetical protein